jgi:endonuclease/exonuclease/phosphatase family metal-dependent hydrolase
VVRGGGGRLPVVRLGTFNVLHGRALSDGRVDLDRFAAAVRELDADVLALQEVDRSQPRSHGVDLTAVAAEAGAASAWRFAAALHGEPGAWSRAPHHEEPSVPAYGVALLSRYAVLGWKVVPLPPLPFRVPMVFRGRWRAQLVDDEPRVAVVARIDTPGGVVSVVCTHLSFLPLWSSVQLHRLVRSLQTEEPLVLMGDLNMGPANAWRASRLRPLAQGDTFPADAPDRQIDHVLSNRAAPREASSRVWHLPLSDHRALSVDLDPAALVAPTA